MGLPTKRSASLVLQVQSDKPDVAEGGVCNFYLVLPQCPHPLCQRNGPNGPAEVQCEYSFQISGLNFKR